MAIIRAFMSQRTCCQCFELFTCTVYSIIVSKNLKDWTNAKGQKRAYWRCKHFCPPSQNIGGLWLISLWSSRCYQHLLLLSVKIHFWKEFGTSHEYIFPLFIPLLVGRWSFLLVVRNWHVHCPAYWYVPWKHTCSAAMFWIWKILTLARPSSSTKKDPVADTGACAIPPVSMMLNGLRSC